MRRIVTVLAMAFAALAAPAWAQETPRPGGELVYSILAEPPSFDAHQEATFAVPHTTAPFYSLLVKLDPAEYPKVVPDLAESWTISPDGRTYEFKLRDGVKFHDGSLLTARDVKASLDHVVFPPAGVASPRKAVYAQVEAVEAPNPRTVRVRLKRAQPGMLTFLASPWNYVYKAELLEKDPQWHKKNVMGTGPFKFGEYVPGSHVTGTKNPDYFVKGLPYLDGFRGLFIVDGAARVAAFRGGRVGADFVGATPLLDQASLKQALGDKLVIQKSPWSCVLTITFNHEKKPFDDPRVRRALSLALDRREAARVLNEFSEYGTVAGLSQPGAPYAMPEAELEKVPGYWRDVERSRDRGAAPAEGGRPPRALLVRLHQPGHHRPLARRRVRHRPVAEDRGPGDPPGAGDGAVLHRAPVGRLRGVGGLLVRLRRRAGPPAHEVHLLRRAARSTTPGTRTRCSTSCSSARARSRTPTGASSSCGSSSGGSWARWPTRSSSSARCGRWRSGIT